MPEVDGLADPGDGWQLVGTFWRLGPRAPCRDGSALDAVPAEPAHRWRTGCHPCPDSAGRFGCSRPCRTTETGPSIRRGTSTPFRTRQPEHPRCRDPAPHAGRDLDDRPAELAPVGAVAGVPGGAVAGLPTDDHVPGDERVAGGAVLRPLLGCRPGHHDSNVGSTRRKIQSLVRATGEFPAVPVRRAGAVDRSATSASSFTDVIDGELSVIFDAKGEARRN